MIKRAFTLVELIVVITILSILWTIAFISLQSYSSSARDSVRVSDISNIEKSFELFHIESWKYPLPTSWYEVTYWSWKVWTQWLMWETTTKNIDKLDKIPLDPLTWKEYTYSLLNNRQEYELAWIVEWEALSLNVTEETYAEWETEINAFVSWNYNWELTNVSKSWTTCMIALPSIVTTTETTLEQIVENDLFVYNRYKNLPSNYKNTKFKLNWETSLKLVNSDWMDLFCWNFEELKTNESVRLNFVENLQKSFSGTQVEKKWKIKEVLELSIDKTNPQPDFKIYTIDLVEEVLWEEISKEQKQAAYDCNSWYVNLWECTLSTTITSLDEFIWKWADIWDQITLNWDWFTNQIFERCNDIWWEELWSDNCLDTDNANVVVTTWSRTNLPLAENNTRINLTKQLWLESNNTVNWVQYSFNTNFYQWFYYTTWIITNNMTDWLLASDYYWTSSAWSYPVYPDTWRRISDNLRYSSYIEYYHYWNWSPVRYEQWWWVHTKTSNGTYYLANWWVCWSIHSVYRTKRDDQTLSTCKVYKTWWNNWNITVN